MNEDDKAYIQGVATEALETLATVAKQAQQRLESFRGLSPDDLTDFNVATDGNALQRLNSGNYQSLTNPAR